MSVYKDKKYNTWRVVYRYVDWTGKMKQCQKRGFKNKRDAQGKYLAYQVARHPY